MSLYVVSKLLLAGLTFPDIEEITGWPKNTIRDHAHRVGFRLPTAPERLLNIDLMVSALVQQVATQGFTQREAIRLLKVPQRVIRRLWPQGVPPVPIAESVAALALALLKEGKSDLVVRRTTGLSKERLTSVKRQANAS